MIPFHPRIIDALKGYTRGRFFADLSAGVTVSLVALPLAMAFAIASGLKPEAGIYTSIVAGFLIAAFGGSSVQIGGPAGAFIVVVYDIVQHYGVANLLFSTMLAGALLFFMGLSGLGRLVRFVPVSIVIGFTNGIAVLIILSQLRDFLGLSIDHMPANFFAQLNIIWKNLTNININTCLLSISSLGVMITWSKIKFLSRVPGSIIAIVLSTLVVVFGKLEVTTIGSHFGELPNVMPILEIPHFRWESIQDLFIPTMTITILCAIESLLCARVADNITGERHNPNQELMAQGIANLITPLFGGFCATGTIARTVTNIRSGATSPVAGIIHAILLFIIVYFAASLAKYIPLGTLAAILIFVAFRMGEWHEFIHLKNYSNNYRIILLVTFFLTILIDLMAALEVGLMLACLFFITRMSSLTSIEPISDLEKTTAGIDADLVEAYRITGSLFFGAVSKLDGLLDPKRSIPKVTILDMSSLINLDTTGLEAIKTLYNMIIKQKGILILSGLKHQPLSLLQRSGFNQKIGHENIMATLPQAWQRAQEML